MSNSIKILFLGDLIGRPGRLVARQLLPEVRQEYSPDIIIANAENSASGFGITERVYQELTNDLEIDVLTSGNHIWDKKEITSFINSATRLVRPYNYPSKAVPGTGFLVTEVKGTKVAIGNLLGCVFMGNFDSPFKAADEMLAEIPKDVKCVFLDFHAEATSEKSALGWYLDGRVSAFVGTHTHIQTADERILLNGTAYISDVGMCGGVDSVIGVQKEKIIERFLTQMPVKFSPAFGKACFNAVLIEIDSKTGKAVQCLRIQKYTEVKDQK